MINNKPILLLEDDKVDAMTIKRALKDLHVINELIVVENGEEAIRFLNDEANPTPGIILMDINMPRMNGIEFLKAVRNDPKVKIIPKVVLTTSIEERDKFESYNQGVSGYMIKPVDYLQFVEVVRTINMYWTLCELP